jgi:uncharacterized protein (DUF302 family)
VSRFDTTVAAPLEEIEPKVHAVLEEQGFGVLTEIDVAATLRAKLGVVRPPLKILGASNPTFARQALEIDPSASLPVPRHGAPETTDAGTHGAIVDPRALMDEPGFVDLADAAAGRLRPPIETLAAP